MWARIVELLLALWLAICGEFPIAAVITLFSGLSFFPKLNKMHLLQILPAGWMLYQSFIYPTHELPFALQNYVVVALNLLLFAIIPSHASDHPRPWKKYLNERSRKE